MNLHITNLAQHEGLLQMREMFILHYHVLYLIKQAFNFLLYVNHHHHQIKMAEDIKEMKIARENSISILKVNVCTMYKPPSRVKII